MSLRKFIAEELRVQRNRASKLISQAKEAGEKDIEEFCREIMKALSESIAQTDMENWLYGNA